MLLGCLLMSGCETMDYCATECDVFAPISAHVNDDPLTKQQVKDYNVRYLELCE